MGWLQATVPIVPKSHGNGGGSDVAAGTTRLSPHGHAVRSLDLSPVFGPVRVLRSGNAEARTGRRCARDATCLTSRDEPRHRASFMEVADVKIAEHDARKVERYTKPKALMNAVQQECANVHEALFARSWDRESATDWESWLRRGQHVDREALEALSKLTDGLRAAIRFCEKHPIRGGKECRKGLRAEHVVGGEGSQVLLYLDPDTLPPNAPAEWRSELAPKGPIETIARPGAFFPTEYTYKAFLPELGSDVESGIPVNAVASLPVEISCSRSLELTAYGLLLHAQKTKLERLLAALAPLGDGRDTDWESRLAVVSRWDRSYAPGELRG